METKKLLEKYVIVLYDGTCGFCNQSILFILNKKPSDRLRFISQQSNIGKQIKLQFNINEQLDSIFLIENQIVYTKANGFLKILSHLNSKWYYISYLKYVPNFISNPVYDLIAKYRHQFISKSCRLLSLEERKYFI
ncbi:thiol-disulfide oxidoreductase DCC family protein [Tenacibaculum sp. ZS6-P6]|uniref:thiol-disulfide oxidoreductase DCC family protein n=1 Tax=Tenacibaculum sp. ZS6-P6 TaxID=3447503 RepID=UPI003F9CBAA0